MTLSKNDLSGVISGSYLDRHGDTVWLVTWGASRTPTAHHARPDVEGLAIGDHVKLFGKWLVRP